MKPVTPAVVAMLKSENVQVTAGLERLAYDLTVQEDISADLVGGSVDWNFSVAIAGGCQLQITRPLAWSTDLLRPYLTLTDGTTTARFDLGVFVVTTPERTVGEDPITYDVHGEDRVYLLDRQVGDTYTASGDALTAVQTAIAAAGLTGVLLDTTAAGVTLPQAMTWPLITEQGRSANGRFQAAPDGIGPTTWLQVVNGLLRVIGYQPIWADENGMFRSGPDAPPAQVAPAFTFDADDPSTTVDWTRTVVEDQWNRPNRWVFVRNNMPGDPPAAPTVDDGIYIHDESTGLMVRNSVVEVEAADQASLVAIGDLQVAQDKRISTQIKLRTAPFPCLGHADVYSYNDATAGVSAKVRVVTAKVDVGDADTDWLWEVVA